MGTVLNTENDTPKQTTYRKLREMARQIASGYDAPRPDSEELKDWVDTYTAPRPMVPPEWKDGEPANLYAAAHDALAWLKWMQWLKHTRLLSVEEMTRIQRAIAQLESFLPPLPVPVEKHLDDERGKPVRFAAYVVTVEGEPVANWVTDEEGRHLYAVEAIPCDSSQGCIHDGACQAAGFCLERKASNAPTS